ncbi:unnamed protein product [Rhizophagus irregularis]|uniref:Uncharacterized protein n=3 Tax=Rhizophagus irregularis TaxID=588596 RepID=A0A915ZWK5_9GLOM|nr:hypothetical protein RirG_005160 [Rhizophagus irregularis DAOM 197198w]UZO14712.1 hypothetical protein OCT59_006161 [Rhizophagus irregularis]GBC38472.1 hypothetical protein RIR_jg4821.t1 [Rhizophagus irregularis DAOM 181602=DAOM 197198]CAB4410167.1 unnamed protein product [Rhizophagus irregularis]CAB5101360.1 unnamed protein product [Rhizophagus irregularis]
MCDVQVFAPHKPDFENYYYFAINLITRVIPEPSPATYLQGLSQRIPELEYLGPVGHLDDAVQVRVKKSEEIDIDGLIDGFETIKGVESAELQSPKFRNRRN